MIRWFFNLNKKNITEGIHLEELKRLGFFDKLRNQKVQRHLFAVGLGIGVMYIGCGIAHLAASTTMPIALDLIGYLIHGIGALPILTHMDSLLKVFLD